MHPKAFSLVELSIVLVIIGLLVGGVLGGRTILHSAELRSVAIDVENYRQATQQFVTKFGMMPGDFSAATGIWDANVDCPTPATVDLPRMNTCNGNGNGTVGQNLHGYYTADEIYEIYTYWQHLGNAELINGHYTGTPGAGSEHHHILGVNAPKMSYSGGGIMIAYVGLTESDVNVFDSDYGHIYTVGKAATNSSTVLALFTPAEANAIDEKNDDGIATSGMIMAHKSTWGSAPGCTTTDDSSAVYALEDNRLRCALIFKTGF